MMLTNFGIDTIKGMEIREIAVEPLYDSTTGTYIFDELISEKL